MKTHSIPLRLTMSDGLFIYSARVRENDPVITLLITDFNEDAKVFLDTETKTLVRNEFDVKMIEKDIEVVLEEIGKKMEKKDVK